MTTAIIDLELGNIGSVSNMLKHIGQSVEIVTDPNALADASSIILPGVGSFDAGMGRMSLVDGEQPCRKLFCKEKRLC